MYECLHCGKLAVVWDCDLFFEDDGYEVHKCHCTNCNASIIYVTPISVDS